MKVLTEKELMGDISLKNGYSKKYTSALTNLITMLYGLIEFETHNELRDEYKSLLKLVIKRLDGIYEMFNR